MNIDVSIEYLLNISPSSNYSKNTIWGGSYSVDIRSLDGFSAFLQNAIAKLTSYVGILARISSKLGRDSYNRFIEEDVVVCGGNVMVSKSVISIAGHSSSSPMNVP